MPPDPPAQRDDAATTTLRNILLLEQHRGYDNRAVVGGLAGLVARLGPVLPIDDGILDRMQRYEEQPTTERAAVIAEALRAIAGDEPRHFPIVGAQPLVPSPRSSRTTPAPRGTEFATRPPSPQRTTRVTAELGPDTPIAALPGIGPTRARQFAALAISTVGDLRLHLPHRYVVYPPPERAASLGFQHMASFEGEVRRVEVAPLPGRRVQITAVLGDETGTIAAVWIRAGNPPTMIRTGARLAVSGPLVTYGRQVSFENPEYELAAAPPLNTRGIVPVYPLTAGLSQQFMRSVARRAVESLPSAEECLPIWLLAEEGLLDRDSALREVHHPTSEERLESARLRLGFEELLPIQLLVLQRRLAYQSAPAPPIPAPWGLLAEFRRALPFSLTGGQQRVLSAILEDLSRPRPMVRLLQGEVGSGKTVVAAMALLVAVASGRQAAMMAPTEVLAEQHFRTLTQLYETTRPAIDAALGHPFRVEILSGALSRAQRQRILRDIAAGEVDIVVGTHAVIQSDVEFPRLALAVVDEQHRFGVNQRVAIRRKGENPHLLVMTATPIPRTLELTLYGDLDFSLLDEMPAGRQPIRTVLLGPPGRRRAFERVQAEVANGHQGFVICPLVEGSAAVEARAATTEFEELRRGDLAGLRLALLHGRMRPVEKDRVMRAFSDGDYDVLVATSVVEVGVDVPNATVMVIEGGERFGLAQLHQFRGRVGRGSAPAVCFLIAGTETPESLARLEAVVQSNNGLELAEEDLRLRGPGDAFGVRQSGMSSLKLARLADLPFVERVRRAAARVLEGDPLLGRPEHGGVAQAVRRLAEEGGEAN